MNNINNKKIKKILQEDPILKEENHEFFENIITEMFTNGWNPNQTKRKIEWIKTLNDLTNLKKKKWNILKKEANRKFIEQLESLLDRTGIYALKLDIKKLIKKYEGELNERK